MRKYKYYLFDFDGTLVDSFPSLFLVFDRAYSSVGVKISNDDVPWLSRVPLEDGYKRLNAPYDKEHIDIFAKNIIDALDSREALELTELFHDSVEFFNYIKENDVKCGIVTSNNAKHVREVLEFFNIDPNIFVIIVGNELTKKSKPDPDPINTAIKLLNYKGDLKDIIYVGDAENDVLAGIAANVDTLLLDRGTCHTDKYQKIYSLMELFKD